MFQTHCKLQYGTMSFLEPSPAQRVQKNMKNTRRKPPPNPLKMVPGGLQKPLPKNIPQKTTQKSKIPKMYDLGVPKKQGSNEEWTNFSSLFRLRASLGPLWGTPDTEIVQRPPPRASGTPPRRQCFMIFAQFLTPVFGSCCCFVGLFSLSLCHARTKNAVGTVAEIARRATVIYIYIYTCTGARTGKLGNILY